MQPVELDCFSEVLLILHAQRVAAVDHQSGNDQGREHGDHDTKCQRLGKALDRSGRHQVQDEAGDQGGNIAVDDRGKCFLETNVNRRLYRLTGGKLLADTGIDNDVCVNSHTDRQDDAGDSGKRQCHVKRVDCDQIQRRIEYQCKSGDNTGHFVCKDHDQDNDDQTDDAAFQRCTQSLLT